MALWGEFENRYFIDVVVVASWEEFSRAGGATLGGHGLAAFSVKFKR